MKSYIGIVCAFVIILISSIANASFIGDEVWINYTNSTYIISALEPEYVLQDSIPSEGWDSNLNWINFTAYLTTTIDLGGPDADVKFTVELWYDNPDVTNCMYGCIPPSAGGTVFTQWTIGSLDWGGTGYIAGVENIIDPYNIIVAGPGYYYPTTLEFNTLYDLVSLLSGQPGAISMQFDLIPGNPVPIPSALWLFGFGLIGIVEVRRRFLN